MTYKQEKGTSCGLHYPHGCPWGCPNVGDRFSAQQIENSNMEHALEEALAIARAVYIAVHREGWEPGPTRSEAIDRLHSWLCDNGRDPNDEPGPGGA